MDLTAYRDCLTKQGVNFGTPGSGSRPNATDPKVQAAMKACADKLPAGAQGGFGVGGRNFAGIRDCLTKKGITLPAGGFGGAPGGGAPGAGAPGTATGGTPPALDAKTLKAMQECQAAAQSAVTTTIKKWRFSGRLLHGWGSWPEHDPPDVSHGDLAAPASLSEGMAACLSSYPAARFGCCRHLTSTLARPLASRLVANISKSASVRST